MMSTGEFADEAWLAILSELGLRSKVRNVM